MPPTREQSDADRGAHRDALRATIAPSRDARWRGRRRAFRRATRATRDGATARCVDAGDAR